MKHDQISYIGFKSLFIKESTTSREDLKNLLSNSDLEKIELTAEIPLEILSSNMIDDFIDHVHPSWIQFFLERYTDKDKLILIQAFPKQETIIFENLQISIEKITLSNLLIQYIRSLFYEFFLQLGEQISPIYILANESLLPLLSFSQKNLSDLIYLLSLYDLKDEVKKIIDKEKLHLLKEALPGKFWDFFKIISEQKQKLSFPEIGLKFWNGNIDDLLKLLKTRGMNRLAKIISLRSSSFYWHLNLLFSIDDAKIFKKLMVKSVDKEVQSLLEAELDEAISYLKNYKES